MPTLKGKIIKYKGRYAIQFVKGETEKYGLKIGDDIEVIKITKANGPYSKVTIEAPK